MRAIDLLIGPPILDHPMPTRPPEGGRVYCGAAPMVTTSLQPVHVSLHEHRQSRRLDALAERRERRAPTEEMNE
jgi:hypothetical protein